MDCDITRLRALVRHIPDFPAPGIRFADITPVLADADALVCAIDLIADEFVNESIDVVAGIDARGFILAAPIARRLGCGFIPVRKSSKLPYKTHRIDYDLEYGSGSLEVHQDAAHTGQRVLIIDDVLATGGTSRASAELIERTGATVAAFGFLASIEGLSGADLISDYATVIALGAV